MRILFAQMLIITALLFRPAFCIADAGYPGWETEFSSGYNLQYGLDGKKDGMFVSAGVGWRFWDSFHLKAQFEYMLSDPSADQKYHMLAPSAGIEYQLDFTPFLPYFGGGLGPYSFKASKADSWKTLLGLQYYAGFSYFIIPQLGMGVVFEKHHVLTGNDVPSGYFNAGIRLIYYFL